MRFWLFFTLLFLGCNVLAATPVSQRKARPVVGSDVSIPVQTHFDTPVINPVIFSQRHDLEHAVQFAKDLCYSSGYHCIQTQQGDTWKSLFPDYKSRKIVMRLNRTNVPLSYRSWLLVPKHWEHLDYMAMSPMALHRSPGRHSLLVVNLKKFAFGAYDKLGNLLYWGPASGGRAWCSMLNESCLTVEGDYKIYLKKGALCRSSKYPLVTNGGAPMPYCMFYYKGYAIHGSTLSGFLNHSRGCVRVFNDDAKWLSTQFAKLGTHVLVIR